MNANTFAGWTQIIMGFLSLAFQGYQLFNGSHVDPGAAAISTGLVAGGAAHVTNGRK